MLDALQDITVLEVGVMTPGKYCGFLMTGWGAKSIRIERDSSRDGISNEDLLLNRGKQSIALNLRDPNERKILFELAQTADVLIESYRPGVTARLEIDYDVIRAVNNQIIYCSLSGFGRTGPDAGRAAYDLLFQAESGLLHALHANGSEIVPPQVYLADAIAGLMAAFAIAAALQARTRTGRGRQIDLSMQESLFSLLSVSHGTIRDGEAISARDSANWSRRPVYNVYRARDGRYVAITALSEKSCRALFRYFGNEDLWEQGFAIGDAGRESIDFLQQCFARNDARHWVDALAALEIEIAMVKTPQEAFDSPQLHARNMSIATEDRSGRLLRQIGFPATPRAAPDLDPAPEPGADRQAIQKDLAAGTK